MGQRILVFEADSDFAKEVEANFANLGTEVEVVTDGTVGLERAAQDRPDLILLSIELPSMNGFLVCKKIKKNAQLKDIPLVILSSDANADEIFEQHKKLRTRAEEYIRKPVTFDHLLERIRRLVPIGRNGEAEALEVSEAVPVVEGDSTGVHDPVDDEIDAFTDRAFEALMVGAENESTAVGDIPPETRGERTGASTNPPALRGKSTPPPAEEGAEFADAEPIEVDVDEMVEVGPEEPRPSGEVAAEISKVQKAPPSGEPGVGLSDELDAARQRISSLEHALQIARRRAADADRLEKMVAELRSKVGRGGGISSREFLDLRGALNKKDKEILDLKDQVTARDKQVLELRDKNLELERGKADFEDRILDLERRIAEQDEQLEALRADKESAAKRNEDLKARLERAEDEARKLEEELDGEREARRAEVEALKAEHEQLLAEAEERAQEQAARAAAEHAQEMETLRENHAAELERLRNEHSEAMENARLEHETALEQARKAAEEAKETAVAEVRAQLTGEMESKLEEAEQRRQAEQRAAEEAKERALAELREELEDQRAAEVERLTAEHEARLEELEERHSRDLSLLGRRLSETEGELEKTSEKLLATEQERDGVRQELERRTGERDTLQARLSAAKASIAELEGRVKERDERIASLEAARQGLERRLEAANTKIETDSQLLERARKAVAIGLGLLEDQKNNRIEP